MLFIHNVFLKVRVSVIQMLPSAEIDDLPVVVKFVLQSVGDGDAFEVRRQLEIINSFVKICTSEWYPCPKNSD